jgi:hypothetical protein
LLVVVEEVEDLLVVEEVVLVGSEQPQDLQ